jgi:hypothetical protein
LGFYFINHINADASNLYSKRYKNWLFFNSTYYLPASPYDDDPLQISKSFALEQFSLDVNAMEYDEHKNWMYVYRFATKEEA